MPPRRSRFEGAPACGAKLGRECVAGALLAALFFWQAFLSFICGYMILGTFWRIIRPWRAQKVRSWAGGVFVGAPAPIAATSK